MIKDTIEINGIQVEIIEFNKDDTKSKVGIRPIVYEILTHVDKDDISIYWINRISKDFKNNGDEFETTIHGVLEHIGKDKIILTSHGSLSIYANADTLTKSFVKHVLYEQAILNACGFYQIYFNTNIPRHVDSLSIYENQAGEEFLDMLVKADIIESLLM